jgi:hypothetical protein
VVSQRRLVQFLGQRLELGGNLLEGRRLDVDGEISNTKPLSLSWRSIVAAPT